MPKQSETLTLQPPASTGVGMQPPHKLNAKEQEFQKNLSLKEKELHVLATQMLGSSYFAGKTHAYKAWTTNQDKQSPTTK